MGSRIYFGEGNNRIGFIVNLENKIRIAMTNPEDQIPPDDSDEFDAADQQSQQDIHSNGLDETPVDENTTDTDILQQSYNASESAYTLNLDEDEKASKKKKN